MTACSPELASEPRKRSALGAPMLSSVWTIAKRILPVVTMLPVAGLGACMFPAMVTAEPSAGPVLVVVTTSGISTSEPRGGPFNPPSFQYRVRTTTGSAKFSVATPAWLRADPKVGATDPSGVLVNIEINAHAKDSTSRPVRSEGAFTNLTNGRGTTIRPAVLTVHVAAAPKGSGSDKNYLLDHKGDWLRTEQGERLLAE